MPAGVSHILLAEDGVGILLAMEDTHDNQQFGTHDVINAKFIKAERVNDFETPGLAN